MVSVRGLRLAGGTAQQHEIAVMSKATVELAAMEVKEPS
jgi:hypothetical protein